MNLDNRTSLTEAGQAYAPAYNARDTAHDLHEFPFALRLNTEQEPFDARKDLVPTHFEHDLPIDVGRIAPPPLAAEVPG